MTFPSAQRWLFRDGSRACHEGLYDSDPCFLPLSMAIGAGLGLVIGVVITKGKVPPIVCTLGFMNIYRGLTYLIAKSQWVAAYQFTDSFKNFALTKYLGFGIVNNMIAVTIYCYIIFFVVMKWTTVGRRVYAVGSNAEAAAVSGININHVKMGVYTLMGFYAGWEVPFGHRFINRPRAIWLPALKWMLSRPVS